MVAYAALPARYDQVGSFLRPQYLLQARARRAVAGGGPMARLPRLTEGDAPWKCS
jgi:hypothetical protein